MTIIDRSPDRTSTTRRFWPPRRAHLVTAAATLALVVVGVVAVVLFDHLTRTVVPDLSGHTAMNAVTAVEEADLVFRADEELSDAVCTTNPPLSEYCEVTGQSLEPHTRVRPGTTLMLVIEVLEVTIPDFTGLTFDEAAALADQLHIRVKPDNDVIANVAGFDTWPVTGQSRGANDVVEADTLLKLSLETPLVDSPQVVGLPFQEALDALAAVGIAGTYSTLPGSAANDRLFVRTADPAADASQVHVGSEVRLQWGYKIPDVVGMSQGMAVSTLQEAGFDVDGPTYGSDRVTAQAPAGGSIADPSKKVQLSLAPPTVTYEVIGDGTRATITWVAPGTFDISQATDARLPWRMTFETESAYRNFNAQIMSGSTVTCNIYVNGELLKTNTSTGRFSVVSCG